LPLTLEEIQKVVEELEKETKALKKEIFKLAWFMRGALSLSEAFELDVQDRILLSEIIEDNLKTTKESGLPFF
jgi:hypothetical protein